MIARKLFTTSILTATLWLAAAPTQAQPDDNNPPKAANPPAQVAPGGAEWNKMTPAQKREALRQIIDQAVRGTMTHLNYTDKTMQDAVVACAYAQEDALEPVREEHRKVVASLMLNANDDEAALKAMETLRAAIEIAREKRTEAIAELENQIEFSKKPRLNVFLSIGGITGDESVFMTGIVGNFTSAMANFQRQLG